MRRPEQRQIKFSSVRAPKWNSPHRTSIDCIIKFDHVADEVPFTAAPYDSEPHGREIFQRVVAGEFGEIAPFTSSAINPPTPQEALAALSAWQQTPFSQELADKITRHNEEIASRSGRGIAAHAESVLSESLTVLLQKGGISPTDARKMGFSRKINKAAALGLISVKESDALSILRDIRNEVVHGVGGTFYTEEVRTLVNSLQSCLSNYVLYNPTTSIHDGWIDWIFNSAYTVLDASLQARLNPDFHAQMVT